MPNSEIILIGGAGKTGGRIAERLTRKDLNFRFASRSTARPFDWEKPAGWSATLNGARSAYTSFQPDLVVSWAADAIGALASTAVDCGLTHIVLLSGRGEEGARRVEEALKASGIGYTNQRASWFCQNFSEGVFAEPIAAGELALPAGAVKEPFIDAGDIADAAVAALTDPRHIGKTYELTGPRALTFREAVAEIAAACGRNIAYRHISMAEFKERLHAAGLPNDMIDLLEELFTQVLDGRNSLVGNGVAEMLGHPARDFTDYACDAAANGTWRI